MSLNVFWGFPGYQSLILFSLWFVRTQGIISTFFVYEVGFIREKGKATAREMQQSPEAGSSYLYFFIFVKICFMIQYAMYFGESSMAC
jgi:hypothetical protein